MKDSYIFVGAWKLSAIMKFIKQQNYSYIYRFYIFSIFGIK